jgi:phosphatidylglycerophosphatase A
MMTVTRPTFSFLWSHPAHFIALGFGAGLAPVVPGTFGTLLALPIAWALHAVGNDLLFVGVIVALLIVGVWASQVTGRHLGAADHGAIVIDEVAAFLLVLFFVDEKPLWQIYAFLLFRVFDIVKPPPAGYVDRAIKNGVGVMLDDLLAAAYTLLVLVVTRRLLA